MEAHSVILRIVGQREESRREINIDIFPAWSCGPRHKLESFRSVANERAVVGTAGEMTPRQNNKVPDVLHP